MAKTFDKHFPVCLDANMGAQILSAERDIDEAVYRLQQLANRVEDQELRKEILAELDRI